MHNTRTDISICCVYICMIRNLSVQQINILNSRNGSTDSDYPFETESILTWYLGFYSSWDEFVSQLYLPDH